MPKPKRKPKSKPKPNSRTTKKPRTRKSPAKKRRIMRPPTKKPRTASQPTPQQAYRAAVAARLKDLLPALVKELREYVFVFPFPSGAKSLDYEIHDPGLCGPVEMVGYFMDGDGGQVMITKPDGSFDAYIEVLKSVNPVLTVSEWERLVAPGVSDLETWRINESLIREWFTEGWKTAGGAKLFPMPASIAVHDGDPTPLPTAESSR